jgi:hypothetical protein
MKMLGLLSVAVLLACEGEHADVHQDSERPDAAALQANCECATQTAASLPYDNKRSGLTAAKVQDALDELALRSPVAQSGVRIYTVEKIEPMNADYEAPVADCNAGDIAIGGGCSAPPAPGVALVSSAVSGRSFQCTWMNPQLMSGRQLKVTATCLHQSGGQE